MIVYCILQLSKVIIISTVFILPAPNSDSLPHGAVIFIKIGEREKGIQRDGRR